MESHLQDERLVIEICGAWRPWMMKGGPTIAMTLLITTSLHLE